MVQYKSYSSSGTVNRLKGAHIKMNYRNHTGNKIGRSLVVMNASNGNNESDNYIDYLN